MCGIVGINSFLVANVYLKMIVEDFEKVRAWNTLEIVLVHVVLEEIRLGIRITFIAKQHSQGICCNVVGALQGSRTRRGQQLY